MFTRATVPFGFPQAPLIPVCNPSLVSGISPYTLIRLAIRPCARQYFVYANDMIRMCANTHMKPLFTSDLHQVFVCADAGCFECFCVVSAFYFRIGEVNQPDDSCSYSFDTI